MSTSSPSRGRTGSALLLTVIVISGVAVMLMVALESANGRRQVERLSRQKANAEQAALSIAKALESRLQIVANKSQLNLTTDITSALGNDWLSRGYVDGTTVPAAAAKGIWVNDVQVFWRIEPVMACDRTLSDVNSDGVIDATEQSAAGVTKCLVNYEADVNNPAKARTPYPGEITNVGMYMYEITADAYALRHKAQKTTLRNETVAPSDDPTTNALVDRDKAEAFAQVKRHIQVKFRRLFEYLIFYAASGKTGDMEVHPGPTMALIGAVHTNGALYLIKQGNSVVFGSSESQLTSPEPWVPKLGPVRVTACKGFYRLKKADMVNAGYTDPQLATLPTSLLDTYNLVYINSSPLAYSNLAVTTTVKGVTNTTNVPIPGPTSLAGPFLPRYDSRPANIASGSTLTGLNENMVRDGVFRSQSPKNLRSVSGDLVQYRPLEPFLMVAPDSDQQAADLLGSAGSYSIRTGAATGLFAADQLIFTQQRAAGVIATDVWPNRPDLSGTEIMTPGLELFGLPAINTRVVRRFDEGAAMTDTGITDGPLGPTGVPLPSQTVGQGIPLPHAFPPAAATDLMSNLNACIPQQVGGIETPILNAPVLNRYIRNALGLTRIVASGDGIVILERGQQITGVAYTDVGTADISIRRYPGLTVAQCAAAIAARNTAAMTTIRNYPPVLATDARYAAPVAGGPLLVNAFLQDYCTWMRSNYVVYFGIGNANGDDPLTSRNLLDITDPFFHVPANAADQTDLLAREDCFIDRREAIWMRYNGYIAAAAQNNSRVTTLTLNIGAICTFIQTTPLKLLMPGVTGNVLASTRFNGAIYASRTPRFAGPSVVAGAPLGYGAQGVYHPLAPLGFHVALHGNQRTSMPTALLNGLATGTGPRYPAMGDSERLTLNGFTGHPMVQFGATNAWATYPSLKRVKLANARAINWGGDVNGWQGGGRIKVSENNTTRYAGLTVYTPNPCYLEGEYNNVADTPNRKYPPCALYCDSLSVLSNNWSDAYQNANPGTTPVATATVHRLALVVHNVPTDLSNVGAANSPYVDEGSGGTHNVLRYLENWANITWCYIGSLVVLDRGRYTRGYNGGPYSPPDRKYVFNSDLFTAEGQPPFAEYVVETSAR